MQRSCSLGSLLTTFFVGALIGISFIYYYYSAFENNAWTRKQLPIVKLKRFSSDISSQHNSLNRTANHTLQNSSNSIAAIQASQCHETLNHLLQFPGSTELDQFLVALNISDRIANYSSRTFRATLARVTYSRIVSVHDNCAVIYLTEHRPIEHRFSIAGGSGFHAVAMGNSTIASCPYVDYGNNTYAIFCPMYDSCVNVDVRLLYINYVAYNIPPFRHSSANVPIVNQLLCQTTQSHHIIPKPNVYWMKSPKSPYNPTARQGAFPWYLYDSKAMKPLSSKAELETCFRASSTPQSPVYVIGDSHGRNLAYYLALLVGRVRNIVKTHGGFMHNNVTFMFGRYVPDFFMMLRLVLSNRYCAKADARGVLKHKTCTIIFDLGTWNLAYKGTRHFFYRALPDLRAGLADLKRKGIFSSRIPIKIIFFNAPSVPFLGNTGDRNPLAVAALNKLLVDALSIISGPGNKSYYGDMILVDYFALSRIFIDRSSMPFDSHYLLCNNDGIKGDVGIAIANYIVDLICKQSDAI